MPSVALGKKKDRSRSNRARAYPTSRSVCSMVRCYDLLTYNLRENECHPTISIPQPRKEFYKRSLCYSGHWQRCTSGYSNASRKCLMKVIETMEKVQGRASRGEKNDGKHKTLPCIERFYFCNLHQQAQNFIKWGYCPFLSENKVFKYFLRCGTLEISGSICSSTVFWSSTRSSLGFLSWKRSSYVAIYEGFMQLSLSLHCCQSQSQGSYMRSMCVWVSQLQEGSVFLSIATLF